MNEQALKRELGRELARLKEVFPLDRNVRLSFTRKLLGSGYAATDPDGYRIWLNLERPDPQCTWMEVLRHEYAHFMGPGAQSHGPEWQRAALRLGVPWKEIEHYGATMRFQEKTWQGQLQYLREKAGEDGRATEQQRKRIRQLEVALETGTDPDVAPDTGKSGSPRCHYCRRWSALVYCRTHRMVWCGERGCTLRDDRVLDGSSCPRCQIESWETQAAARRQLQERQAN
jgi:hypothetical protein